ncbi:MAG: DUF4258 domain-containing protein [Euryarchaeota archaeon]|nr:DUF4258 domain-containing protein [Euryarchaeota archaeon]
MKCIRYSNHARKKMVERGISEKEISNAINRGSKRTQDDKIVATFMYFEVVYKVIDDEAYVITVFVRW